MTTANPEKLSRGGKHAKELKGLKTPPSSLEKMKGGFLLVVMATLSWLLELTEAAQFCVSIVIGFERFLVAIQ